MRTAMGLRKTSWGAAAALGALFVCACNHNAPPAAASANASSPAAPAAASAQIVVSPADAAPPASQTGGFDGAKAYEQVAKLVAFGPHPPDTPAIRAVQAYIHSQLES